MDKTKFNDKKEWRKFGISVAVILLVIATLQLIFGNELYPYFYGVSVLFLLLGLILPILIKPIFILFSYLGFVMGWIMTRVILAILFYVVVSPLGMISRLCQKNFLDLRMSRSTKSYWIDRKPDDDGIKNYEHQF